MSYNPPPARSKYGDTDFSDDSWNQGSGGAINAPPIAPMSAGSKVPMQTAGPSGGLGDNIDSNHVVLGGQVGGGQPPATTPSLTPEDILFIRSVQRESLIKRCLPLMAMTNGAYYLYLKSKGLPNSWVKYTAITAASYILGKLSFRNQAKQRLIETPLNTPFIQAMRKSFGITGGSMMLGGEFNTTAETSYNVTGQAYPQWNESTGTNSSFQSETGYATRQDMSSAYQPFDSANTTESGKPGTSYEELRAKNRGLIR